MKISINMNVNDVIDVMAIAWLEALKNDQKENIERAFLVEDAEDSEELIGAIDLILKHMGADLNDGQV